MNIRNIHLPKYTDEDLEWLDKQPWFYVALTCRHFRLLAKYGTDNEKRCMYLIKPREESMENFNILYKELGFEEAGNTYKGLVDFIDPNHPYLHQNIHLVLFYDQPQYDQSWGFGYNKQFDCKIGFIAQGKFIEDEAIFFLPKDNPNDYDAMFEKGVYIGANVGVIPTGIPVMLYNKERPYLDIWGIHYDLDTLKDI